MNIGYEAKRIFHNKTGLGNYSRDLIRILNNEFPENRYYLYNPKHSENKLFEVNNTTTFEKNPKTNWSKKFKILGVKKVLLEIWLLIKLTFSMDYLANYHQD